MRSLQDDLAYAKECRDRCAGPCAVVVNGVKDLPDIFWLIGWFDWEMEVQLIEMEIALHDQERISPEDSSG